MGLLTRSFHPVMSLIEIKTCIDHMISSSEFYHAPTASLNQENREIQSSRTLEFLKLPIQNSFFSFGLTLFLKLPDILTQFSFLFEVLKFKNSGFHYAIAGTSLWKTWEEIDLVEIRCLFTVHKRCVTSKQSYLLNLRDNIPNCFVVPHIFVRKLIFYWDLWVDFLALRQITHLLLTELFISQGN